MWEQVEYLWCSEKGWHQVFKYMVIWKERSGEGRLGRAWFLVSSLKWYICRKYGVVFGVVARLVLDFAGCFLICFIFDFQPNNNNQGSSRRTQMDAHKSASTQHKTVIGLNWSCRCSFWLVNRSNIFFSVWPFLHSCMIGRVLWRSWIGRVVCRIQIKHNNNCDRVSSTLFRPWHNFISLSWTCSFVNIGVTWTCNSSNCANSSPVNLVSHSGWENKER